jgi:hypothetical protein
MSEEKEVEVESLESINKKIQETVDEAEKIFLKNAKG